MSILSVQGQLLEVTVVGCSKLKKTEWISRQDPYVCLEYASTKYRTRTCTDGGRNATFQEKFVFSLIEGLPEISITVWNSNTISLDDFIGSGRIQLLKVLTQGYDDSAWPLQDKKGKYAGEVRFIMHYSNANKPTTAYPSSALPAMPYGIPSAPQVASVHAYPQTAYPQGYPGTAYPPGYPPTAYPPTSYSPSQAYPQYSVNISDYPQNRSYNQPAPYPSAYPPTSSNPPSSVYPPAYPPTSLNPPSSVYPPAYPPTSLNPPSSVYPPPPQDPRYNPPGSYPPPTYPPYPYASE